MAGNANGDRAQNAPGCIAPAVERVVPLKMTLALNAKLHVRNCVKALLGYRPVAALANAIRPFIHPRQRLVNFFEQRFQIGADSRHALLLHQAAAIVTHVVAQAATLIILIRC